MRTSCAVLVAAAAAVPASTLMAQVTPMGPGDFGPGASVITFGELPIGTVTPFSIAGATFGGLGAWIDDSLGVFGAPPAPSGAPYLYSSSVGNDDTIEIALPSAQSGVGAYFDVTGAAGASGVLRLELYQGDVLLGSVDAAPVPGTLGGFVGAQADGAVITSVVFREVDFTTPISFRIDDVTFVPAPGSGVLLAAACVACCRRRR